MNEKMERLLTILQDVNDEIDFAMSGIWSMTG